MAFQIGGTFPQITYRGVIRNASSEVWDMTFNNDNGSHTQINSIVNMVPYSLSGGDDIDDLFARVGDLSTGNNPAYSNPNKLYAKAGYSTTQATMNVQIWRINGSV